MTHARYYFRRTSADPGNVRMRARYDRGWRWAMIRGVDPQNQELLNIDFTSDHDRVLLAASTAVGSQYEIVFGQQPLGESEGPDDPAFVPSAQDGVPHGDISRLSIGNFQEGKEKDPPPPPGAFRVINLTQ